MSAHSRVSFSDHQQLEMCLRKQPCWFMHAIKLSYPRQDHWGIWCGIIWLQIHLDLIASMLPHTQKKQFNTKRDNFYWEHDVNVHFKQHYIQNKRGNIFMWDRYSFIKKKRSKNQIVCVCVFYCISWPSGNQSTKPALTLRCFGTSGVESTPDQCQDSGITIHLQQKTQDSVVQISPRPRIAWPSAEDRVSIFSFHSINGDMLWFLSSDKCTQQHFPFMLHTWRILLCCRYH